MLSDTDDEELSDNNDVELWDDEADLIEDHEFVQECLTPRLPQDSDIISVTHPMVVWIVGFLLLLQAKHYIPGAAINALLKFLSVLFRVLGPHSTVIAHLAASMPTSVYCLNKHVNPTDIRYFVVCRKCHHLYKFDDCIDKLSTTGEKVSKLCSFIRFPNHTQERFRVECSQVLLKTVNVTSGRRFLYPFKVFPYKTLSSSLKDMLMRPRFYNLCQHWKERCIDSGMYDDIYDGKLWQGFQVYDGKPFLSGPCGLGLALNIDWFQPYTHVTSSVGVIFLSIMNLPRSVRFKRENIILVGILPGPSEPKSSINTYIEPLVNDLKQLWDGMVMEVHTKSEMVKLTVRCALLCIACDLPAGRKLCGFLGHSAKLGCSKCLKKFKGKPGSMNYSGFERSLWPKRNGSSHRRNIEKILKCRTKTSEAELESKYGCRYSVLLELPYFNPCRMLTIDIMHNVYLGTGKHMLTLWLTHGLISSANYNVLQEIIDDITVPADIGRIPQKIASGFSGFTAEQLKNWINLYSVPVLYEILPTEHMECWRYFVLASRILSRRKLSQSLINLSDTLLMKFCRTVQDLYGEMAITPNLHMHAHLQQTVEDYGPAHGFWLFPYERCNGILGKQPNNNRAIESQLMERFLRDNFAQSFNFPDEYRDEYRDEFKSVVPVNDISSASVNECLLDVPPVQFPSRCSVGVLDEDDQLLLTSLYGKLHPDDCHFTVNSMYYKYSSITLDGKTFHCCQCNSKSKSYVAMAEWDVALLGLPPTPVVDSEHPDSKYRPVTVRYFIKISVTTGEVVTHLTVAVVSWNKPHRKKNLIGKPTQVWSHNQFESFGVHSFLPVKYLTCRCAFLVKTIEHDSVLVVIPLVK